MNEYMQTAIDLLTAKHGGLRPAARFLGIDPSYLCRLRSGAKSNPSGTLLRKLGLRRVVVISFLPRIPVDK